MRKSLALALALLMTFLAYPSSSAQDFVYQVGKQNNPATYVEISISNLTSPGTPVKTGDKFRIIANCITNIEALYTSKISDNTGRGRFVDVITDNGSLFSKNIDTNSWGGSCDIQILQKNNPAFRIAPDEGLTEFKINSVTKTSFLLLDETSKAESEDEIYIVGNTSIWNARLKNNDAIAIDNFIDNIIVFTPLPKKTGNSTNILELNGDEDGAYDPTLSFKKESASSYLISLLGYIPNTIVKLRATKTGNKAIIFSAKSDSDGDLVFRVKRNLKGYNLELLDNGKSILSKKITY